MALMPIRSLSSGEHEDIANTYVLQVRVPARPGTNRDTFQRRASKVPLSIHLFSAFVSRLLASD